MELQKFTTQNPIESQENLLELLTNQEVKVLKLASQQFSNKEIANELFIAESTAKKHRENICRKLSIKGRLSTRKFLRGMSLYFNK